MLGFIELLIDLFSFRNPVKLLKGEMDELKENEAVNTVPSTLAASDEKSSAAKPNPAPETPPPRQ